MEHMWLFANFFLHFKNLYPSSPQPLLQLELSSCLKQCMVSGSCWSVFYDKSQKGCLHIEVFLSASDSSLVEKPGALYYGINKAHLEKDCASTPGFHLEESGLCLMRGNLKQPWQAAKILCENDGASLLKIGSREKNNAVKLILDELEWTGGNDLATEGTYVWIDGTPIQGFTEWQDAEPDGGRVQNCMLINAGGWYNGGCGSNKKYTCEKMMNIIKVIST